MIFIGKRSAQFSTIMYIAENLGGDMWTNTVDSSLKGLGE